MADQKQLANLEIRGVTPARDLSSLLKLSINLASAIQILDARTKQLTRDLKIALQMLGKNNIVDNQTKIMAGSQTSSGSTVIINGSDGADGDEYTFLSPLYVTDNNEVGINLSPGDLPTPSINLDIDSSLSKLFVFKTVTNDDGSTTTTLSLANGVLGIPEVMEDGSIELWQSKTCPVARDYGAE